MKCPKTLKSAARVESRKGRGKGEGTWRVMLRCSCSLACESWVSLILVRRAWRVRSRVYPRTVLVLYRTVLVMYLTVLVMYRTVLVMYRTVLYCIVYYTVLYCTVLCTIQQDNVGKKNLVINCKVYQVQVLFVHYKLFWSIVFCKLKLESFRKYF